MNLLFLLRELICGSGRLLGLVLLIVFIGPSARAVEHTVTMQSEARASIRLASINTHWDGLGWHAVNVRIENHASEERTWSFNFEVRAHYGGGPVVSTPAVVRVPPRSTGESVVFVAGPGRMHLHHSARTAWTLAKVQGPGVEYGYQVQINNPRDLSFAHVAASRGVEMEVRRLIPPVPAGSHASSAHEIDIIDPAYWPADWRVWSSFSHVVLTNDEHDRLDGARRVALREWVAQGGELWVVPQNASASGERETLNVGLGRVHHALDGFWASATDRAEQRFAPWQKVAPALLTSEDIDAWKLDRPVLALILFLVVFGVLVGPVNIFVFAPPLRRQRLFLTVPLLSVGASLLLGVVIVLMDGFGGEGARRSIVLLLPGENKAVIVQQQVARTGVLLGDRFELPADTLLAMDTDGLQRSSNVEMRRAGDTAAGAWFSSRSVRRHDLRRIVPTRARVELVEGGENGRPPVVQSSVTTVLRDFRYTDPRGNHWVIDELPPGARMTLSSEVGPDWPAPHGFFKARGGAIDLAPLNTLASIEWRDESILYTGPVEAAHQP